MQLNSLFVSLHLYSWVQESCNSLEEREYESSCKVWTGTEILGIFHGLGITADTFSLLQVSFLRASSSPLTRRSILTVYPLLFLSDLSLLCVEKPGSGAGEGGADRASERERRRGAGSHHQLQHSVNAQKPLYGAGISFQTKLQVIITNYPSYFLPYYL